MEVLIVGEDKTIDRADRKGKHEISDEESMEHLISVHKHRFADTHVTDEEDQPEDVEKTLKKTKRTEAVKQLVDENKEKIIQKSSKAMQLRKEMLKKMEEPVTQDVLIKFKDYRSKLKMMDTALYLFGMKLYR
jgi:hypothetical protein